MAKVLLDGVTTDIRMYASNGATFVSGVLDYTEGYKYAK